MLIITVRKQLEQLFGTDGYTRVRFALDDYAESAGALVLAVDDSDDCAALGLAAVSGTDSGTIVLAVRGARTKLGSDATDGLLIVGGDSVVPHFQITNPVSDRILDEDTVVFSDNPYGAASETLEQYLAPSFPVGRLVQPDNTADNFVTLIKGLTAQHTSGRPNNDGAVMVVNEDWIDYSKRAAGSLPGPQSWHISPGYEMNAADAARAILYFNLHGFSGDPNWKGYSDRQGTFVTAVTPDVFSRSYVQGSIAFAECCYGAETRGRSVGNSCALKLVNEGAAFVGATGLAYGSYLAADLFLEDADFLARAFFSGVTSGNSIGVSLQSARRAYLLDTTENLTDSAWQYKQKTLLQFVLFGDPRWTM